MHPIERLRYVARSGWAGSSALAAEAAWAFADLADHEAPALVPACRRLLDRQPGCGPLWWVAARVLSAGDPVAEAEICAEELEDDPTEELMLDAIPEGARAVRRGGIGEVASADLVVVEVDALGPGGMVADPSCTNLLEAARIAEVPVWVQAGVGRVLPARLWQAMTRRLASDGAERRVAVTIAGSRGTGMNIGGVESPGILMDLDHIETVVGPDGARTLSAALAATDCPEPPELLEAF